MSRSYAHRMIESAAVVKMLPIGNKPATESQARPLAKLPAEEQAEAAAQTRRLLHGHLAAPSSPGDAPATQPAPRLPQTVRGTPPHSPPLAARPPSLRSGGGRRAPHPASAPRSARYARRRSLVAVAARSPPMRAAGHPAPVFLSPSLPPSTPPPIPSLSCGFTRGGREGERHTAGFFHVIGRPPFGEPDEQPPRLIPLAPSPRGAARWSRSGRG